MEEKMDKKIKETLVFLVFIFIFALFGAYGGLVLASLIHFLSYLAGSHYLLWGAAIGACIFLLLGVYDFRIMLGADKTTHPKPVSGGFCDHADDEEADRVRREKNDYY